MKHIKKASILLTFILFLNACKDSGSPESITELFLISLNQMDYTTMNTISTRNTKDMLKIMQSVSKNAISEEELSKRAAHFKVKILKKEMESDSIAWVSFQTEPQLLPFNKLKLRKVIERMDKEAWKIDFSTLDLMQSREATPQEKVKEERKSYDGQVHPEADSTAAEE